MGAGATSSCKLASHPGLSVSVCLTVICEATVTRPVGGLVLLVPVADEQTHLGKGLNLGANPPAQRTEALLRTREQTQLPWLGVFS